MRPDKTSNANQQKGKSPEKIQELKDKKVSDTDASQVKGGAAFNPQPDPPAGQGRRGP